MRTSRGLTGRPSMMLPALVAALAVGFLRNAWVGASAAIESVACVQSILTGWVHPTINQEYPDPDCDLDFVQRSGKRERRSVVGRHGRAMVVPDARSD